MNWNWKDNFKMSSQEATLKENLSRLSLFLREEKKIILAILVYAIVVGLFSLIIPLTVQELVNTFAFAVTPLMVVTLVGIMAGILLFAGVFRVLQFFATDILERRLFVRVALALARVILRFKIDSFQTNSLSRFFETIFLQRAFSSLFVDLINFLVSGMIGMILLAMYHPYFIGFDILLILSVIAIAVLGKGGLRDTIKMSEAKYATYHWFQDVADNLLHFKATNCSLLIQQRADALASDYVQARKSRLRALLRQYIGSIFFQVVTHTGLLGTAGWLLSQGELTLGQLVAAEVIVASLLVNLESVMKRSYVVFYFFTALHELDHLFSLDQDPSEGESDFSMVQSTASGLHLQCSQLNWASDRGEDSGDIQLDAKPGERWAVICATESMRHRISLALSGLEPTPGGTVRYNGVDVRSLGVSQVSAQRSVVFAKDPTLFRGTIMDNISMGRTGIEDKSLAWALEMTQLNDALDKLPDGLETQVEGEGKNFSPGLRLRILLARAIITKPPLLVLDGGLHEIPFNIRKSILEHLGSVDYSWTLIVISTDPNVSKFTQHCLSLIKE